MGHVYLCVDIGGTKTAFACYGQEGKELFYGIFPTEKEKGAAALAGRVKNALADFLRDKAVAAGALACPGPLDLTKGECNCEATLSWKNAPVRAVFEQAFGVQFALLNDCDAAVLGEYAACAAKPALLCYMTVSTGVGGGVVSGGKLLRGRGNAAEFGHLRVSGEGRKCGCGGTDCLELYASGTAIERFYAERTGQNRKADEVAGLAKNGDQTAKRAFEICAEKLIEAFGHIRKILDPSVVVLGGGVTQSAELFLPKLTAAYPGVNIRVSALNGKQGLLGGYEFCVHL
ncbi:MAG: ROK family protein [Firmicutes bacterium]|nr:ROK family protein [Bacillota bacterium]